ncbi:hypothetical protein A1O7_02849 [Cladophialophora yegresii CBS 114405]|uniref:Actin-like ATPase domain-containing protein n=1 Tax=Cladophialophora yegresii CBS 114405 TaxID=1182544 RepID=W9WVW4_9EURO|nr:uncharacterized protein A1O7_02849 [Cladophialophora yegresii CBS 114405]EXJ62414.1 hypothetical protein A1O7_02849 [Cladophialophora yegresii CBS 114405]
MASSGGDIEMLDAPVHEMENLAIGYNGVLKHVGLDGDARLESGVDLGSKFSTINYGRVHPNWSLTERKAALTPVQDINGTSRIPTIAIFVQKTDTPNNPPCELVFGAEAEEDPRPAHEILERIEFFKLCLVAPNTEFPRDHSLLTMVMERQLTIRRQVEAVRNKIPEGKYCVRDPLTGQPTAHTLQSPRCIIREFLRFLLRSAQHQYAEAYGLQSTIVPKIFNEKADAMIAVPTGSIWEVEAKDELRMLLHEAGFPKSTCIWSEPNASAMYDLSETAEKESAGIADIANKEEVRIVCDMGGLTTDVCGLCAEEEYNTSAVQLQGVVPGKGSFHGSQRQNELFKEYVTAQFPLGLLPLSWGFNGSENDLLEAFERGFEITKRSFDGAVRGYEVWPIYKSGQKPLFKSAKGRGLVLNEEQMILSAVVMKMLFDQWLDPIKCMLEECMSRIDSPCTLALTGGGSRPPYVLGYLKQQLERTGYGVQANERVSVGMMASEIDSAVARGNFVYLSCLDMNQVQQARADFAVKGQQPFVTQDANLSGALPYTATGEFRVERPQFPFDHVLDVTSCPEWGTPDNAGVFEIKIPNLERGGWVLEEEVHANNDRRPYVVIAYRLELLLEELTPKLKLDILSRTGRPLGDDMTQIIPLKTLYKHLTSAGDFRKKTEESFDEDVAFEWQPTESGPPVQYTPGIVNPGEWYADPNFGRLDEFEDAS